MSPRMVCGALVLTAALHWSLPPAARAQSGTCAQVISRLDNDLGAFQKDLTKSHVDFVSDDVAKATKEGISPILEHSPTLEGAAKIIEHREQLIDLQQKLQEYQATFDDLVKCINTKGCKLLDHAKRSSKAVWEYVSSLGEPASAARVKEAAALLKTYTARLQGTAQGGSAEPYRA